MEEIKAARPTHAAQRRSRVPNTLALPCLARVQRADNAEQVLEVARDSAACGQGLLPLGQGSNVVLPPELADITVYVGDVSVTVLEETAQSVVLRVGAGMDWHALVQSTLARGWYGLENLALIPGLVGAAPVQNIGAYGREIAEFVLAVHGVDTKSLQVQRLSRQACAFAYRDSVFKQGLRDRFIITSVDIRLCKRPATDLSYPALAQYLAANHLPATPEAVCEAVVALRQARLPAPELTPNVGSFFKNPLVSRVRAEGFRLAYPQGPCFKQADGQYKLSAAWLIDHCELRGFRINDAGVSTLHALVLVNHGTATQADILALAAHVVATVKGRFNVTLETEPRIY